MKDAIAIVGMSCRFPGGVRSPEDYWKLLLAETDAVTEVPADRFSTEFYQHPSKREPGKSYTFAAGVIDDVMGFDADFFGISPREAQQMDPQQRLLLELAWEAFEHAGHAPAQMAGKECAVFIGIAAGDYGDRAVDDLSVIDAYSATGNTLSIASNRISYLFDLRGPSMSIDTACSSSLVALHQACNAIRAGEVDTALAGGVNLLLHPFPFISFAKASMLSPTGRCRAFDADGNGYVRAEGGALVMLKPLSKALADGDTVHAVIASSGVNSDGHSQGGINVPAAATQGALLEGVYARAGIDPRDLAYVEAHGTGTAVGDPIETRALIDVIGKRRSPDSPLLIGSAKTNLGHLETASGMAGLIKAILCLKHRAVPTSIHFRTPNPNIDFLGGNLRVVDRFTELPPSDRPLLIGINSFGFGGTNAHVLLREAVFPANASRKGAKSANPDDGNDAHPAPLMLSARSPEALRALAADYVHRLRAAPSSWQALASATAHRRQPLRQRAVIVPEADEGAVALAALATGESHPTLVTADAVTDDGRLVLVFSGNGSQWEGMGKRLLGEDPVFRNAVAEIDRLWCADGSASLLEVMRQGASAAWLQQTENAQPLLFAMQAGIVQSLHAQGLRFEACYGHSVGEVAAAFAAEALTLEQSVHVIKVRSRAQALTAGRGRMAAVGISAAAARTLIADLDLRDSLEVAGTNSPVAVTLAGTLASLEVVQAHLAQTGQFFQLLDLDYAFHSRQMDGIRDVVTQGLATLKPQRARARFISTVTGTHLTGTELDAGYWWRNIREAVNFEPATRALIEDGMRLFVEIGPHSILRSYVTQSLEHAHVTGVALPTLKRNHDHASQLRHSLATAMAHGAKIDKARLYPDAFQHIVLPNYPWQHTTYLAPRTTEGYDLVHRRREHPLLGYRLKDSAAAWENHVDPLKQALLAGHVIDGAVIFPGAGFAEIAMAAARSHFGTDTCAIENLEIRTPVVFHPQQGRLFRVNVDPRTADLVMETRARVSDDPWTVNVVGRLLVGGPPRQVPAAEPHTLAELEQCPPVAGATLYNAAAAIGLEFGEAFRWVQSVRVHGDVALAELAMPQAEQDAAMAYTMHPGALDSGLHPLLALMAAGTRAGEDAAYIPVQFGRIDCFGAGIPARVVARIERRSPHSLVASFHYFDADGNTLLHLSACRFRRVDLVNRRQVTPGRFLLTLESRPTDADVVELTPPAQLLEAAAVSVAATEDATHRHTHLMEVMPLLDVLAASYALRAVEAMQLIGQAALPNCANPPLLTRLVTMLMQDGVIALRDGIYVHGEESLPPTEDIWRALLSLSSGHVAELTLMAHCGNALPDILRGTMSADAVLPHGRSSLLDQLFSASPTWAHVHAMTRASLECAVDRWQAPRALRVLEIVTPGADLFHPIGAHLLGHCDYTIAGSAEQIGAFDKMRYPLCQTATMQRGNVPALLRDPGNDAAFDVIVVNNLLRASSDPVAMLMSLRGWMRPGALLVLSDSQGSRFTDLVFGLSADWWATPRGDLLPSTAIEHLLAEQGFSEVNAHAEAGLRIEGAPALIVARNGSIPSPRALTPAASATVASWLVVCPGQPGPLAEELVSTVSAHSARVDMVDSADAALVHAFLSEAELAAGDPCHLVFLAADGTTLDAKVDSAALMQKQEATVIALARLVRGLGSRASGVRLTVVTRGGAPHALTGVPADALQPAQATLWGLCRVVMNEYAEMQCRLIDLDPRLPQPARALAAELLTHNGHGAEDEVVLGADARHVSRMVRAEVGELRDLARRAATAPAVLGFQSPGALSHLRWFPLPPFDLEADEVEVEPMAAGLNFRDVMYAMGLLSDEAVESGFAGPTIGMEFSGRVTRVGTSVTNFRAGDLVLGFAPACYASRLRTRAQALALKPERLTFEEAATIPTTFFTAYYALHELARVRAGERVLVHGAAGGVGIAAIQLARHLGAEVYATASTREKREFVRLLGARHVFDSRSLAFADEVRAATGGQGVDIVLNSLAGEAMIRSIDVLRPFGRFLELGKRDFYENSRIGLRPFRNNISYFGIDADQLMDAAPSLTADLFEKVMALLDQGALDPLPYRAFPASQIEDAFRYMQQARQIGKIVITFANGVPSPQDPPMAPLSLDAKAAYLVMGGTGGLGFATVRWMVERGARRVVLASRRGTLAPELAEEVARWHATLGVETTVTACDLNDVSAVQALVDGFARGGNPLKGVVHSAMTIADGLLANIDDDKMRDVLAPKVAGAWNLHQATRALPLDFFVVYSSATTLLGNPGQANYVAANAFLEALVHQRRAQGLPGTYMAWGPLEDVGFLARNSQTLEALQMRIGGRAITSAQAMAALEHVLQAGRAGEAVLWLDWKSVARVMPAARSPRYAHMQGEGAQDTQRTDGDVLEEVRALPKQEAVQLVIETLQAQIARILHLSASKIDADRAVTDLGMDSLMGMELGMAVEECFEVKLPVMMLADGASLRALAQKITDSVRMEDDDVTEAGNAGDIAAQLLSLSAVHGGELSKDEALRIADEMVDKKSDARAEAGSDNGSAAETAPSAE